MTSIKALVDVLFKFKSAKKIYEKEKGTGRPLLMSREFIWSVVALGFAAIAYKTGTNVDEQLQNTFTETVFLVQYNLNDLYTLYVNNKALIGTTIGGVTAAFVSLKKLLEVVKEILSVFKKKGGQ